MPVYDPRGGGNVHIDQILTQISVGYPNNGLVGEALFPAVPVRKQSDKYYIFGRESFSIDPGGDVRAPGTEANEIPGLAVSVDSYFATEHALQIAITPEERENADSPLDPDRDGTELVTGKVMLAREVVMQAMVSTASNYASGYSTTLSGTSQFNDYSNSDPIGTFRTATRTIHAGLFLEPNLAIIPYQVMSQLEDHPDFIERIKYSERGILTAELIATILGMANVIVPGVGINTANPGQTVTLSYLWGKDIILAYVPPRPGLKIPAFAYEYCWVYSAAGTGVQVVKRWWDDDREADVLRVARRYDLKFTAVDATSKSIGGYIIKSAVA
jgi:hypothetical protein